MSQTQEKLKPILIQDQETLRLVQDVIDDLESHPFSNYHNIPKTWTVRFLIDEAYEARFGIKADEALEIHHNGYSPIGLTKD